MQCDIVIPVWNQLALTKDCVNSIFAHTGVDYRLIIIDNASNDETRRYLEWVGKNKSDVVKIVRNDKNVGFIKAVNKGISLSDAPYVCILNNDTIVTRGWLKEMIDIGEIHSDIGIINPSSNTLGQKPARGEPVELYAQKMKEGHGKFIELGAAVGFCMLIKREVINKIGLFDEIYGMGNFDDTDFSRRAVKEGYKCVRSCGAYVYHRESASFNKVKTFEEDFKRNRDIFEFRWGRPKRIAYILDSCDSNTLKRLGAESLALVRGGSRVWYFVKESLDLPIHSNITQVKISGKNFRLKVIFAVIRKKKKFNEIFTDDEKIKGLLEYLHFIHKAKIKYC